VAPKLWRFISSGSIASAPYINQNGVKFVALQTVVLWLDTAIGMTSTHFPFFSPSNIFFIAWKIKQFAFSTASFDCGCYNDAKVTFMPICWQHSLNIGLLKNFALSTIMCLGTPYLQIMLYQKNFLIVAELTFVSGFASIHFVKYLTTITANM
jgi:hypothetical protein